MHQNIRHAIQSYAQASAEQAKLEAKIEGSRAAVAQACSSNKAFRDHPEQIPELPKFLGLLNDKDIYYLIWRADSARMGPQMQALGEMINRFVGGGHTLDHGLRPQADQVFQDFASGVNLSNMGEVVKEMQQGSGEMLKGDYQRYLLARNLSEFNAVGCNVTTDSEVLWLAALAIERPWRESMRDVDPLEESRSYSQALVGTYGKEAMKRAAEAVIVAKKDGRGDVFLPDGSASVYKALYLSLSEGSVSASVISFLLDWSKNFTLEQVAQVRAESRALAAAYGEPALTSAVTTLQTAKRTDLGNIVDASSMGIQRGSSRGSLFDLLAARSPGSYARAIVAVHDKLGTKQEVDQAMAKLGARSSPAEVAASGAAIVAMWKTPRGVLVQREKQLMGFSQHFADGTPGQDYELLTGLVSKTATIPPLEVETTDSPVYAVWSKKPVGTTATYAETSWDVRNGRVSQFAMAGGYGGFVQVFKLKNVNANRVLLETVAGNISERMSDPTEIEVGAKDYALKDRTGLPPQRSIVVSQTKGTQTLVVNGQSFPCTWDKSVIHLLMGGGPRYVAMVEEDWYSDASPGGRVMHRTMVNRDDGSVNVKELVLQPTNVTDYDRLRPGFPAAFRVSEGPGGPDGDTGGGTADPGVAGMTSGGVASGMPGAVGNGAVQTLMRGTRLRVSVAQDADGAVLILGRIVKGTLADNATSRGALVFARGADVKMEVVEEQGQPYLVLQSVANVTGLQTSKSRVTLRVKPAGANGGLPHLQIGGRPFGAGPMREGAGEVSDVGNHSGVCGDGGCNAVGEIKRVIWLVCYGVR